MRSTENYQDPTELMRSGKRHIVWIAIVALSFICMSITCISGKKPLDKTLQIKLDSLTGSGIIPGIIMSVLFENDEEIILSSGWADIEKKEVMPKNAVMFSGSVGKTYVSAVLLKLYEQGLVDLKKKVIEYFPETEWFREIPNSADFTVEMLMNHTAGVPEYVYESMIWDTILLNPDKVWTPKERLSAIFGKSPSNAPGKGWNYADSHYIILGMLIENITGMSYYRVLDDLILKPYGLKKTYPSVTRNIPNLPAGYTSLSNEMKIPEKVAVDGICRFNPQMEWTGGGLASSVSDLTRWASILYGGKVLNRTSMELMLRPSEYRTTLFENAGYGLGCFIGETNGQRYYGHTGFFPGYITYVQYIPEYKLAIAVQMNSDNTHNNTVMKQEFNKLKNIIIGNLLRKQ